MECDPPNPSLSEFHGVIKINDSHEISKSKSDENPETVYSFGLLPYR